MGALTSFDELSIFNKTQHITGIAIDFLHIVLSPIRKGSVVFRYVRKGNFNLYGHGNHKVSHVKHISIKVNLFGLMYYTIIRQKLQRKKIII